MGNEKAKALLSLLLIAAIFAGIGCTGRAADRDGRGGTDQSTPTPAPATPTQSAASPPASPAPTLAPAGPGNYTTDLGLDDICVSNGDEQDGYAEDLLPTPPAE